MYRLHDYYRFNTTQLVEEGVLAWGDQTFPTTGHLSVWDAFKIGTQHSWGSSLKQLNRKASVLKKGTKVKL